MSVIAQFCEWLQSTPLAVSISEDWFPMVESLHVIALATVAGTIFLVDSRLLGLTSPNLRFTYVSERLLPWTWGAFACAALTGSLLFAANAVTYYSNTPFRIKMVLLVLAGLNMLYFQVVTLRGVSTWDSGRPSGAARLAAALSLTLWVSIIAAGRWIGFV
jgi:hypothetical protein